jgi:pyrimidine-nucleoside phosphorylase
VAVVSQSERLVPADRILYALRDVTGTVENEGLIAASIMAKKVASGTSALVLDLTVGSGAFMKTVAQARSLGALCRLIGESYGRKVTCVYTAMDAPLGRAVGNRLEVEEAWELLRGDGPTDLREVVLELAAALLALSDLKVDEAAGRVRAERALDSGQAAEWFERWVGVQGGRFKPGEFHRLACDQVVAARDGWVSAVDARAVGSAAQLAGAGRGRVDDEVDSAAGVVLAARPGEQVAAGDTLARVYSRRRESRAAATALLHDAFAIADEVPAARPVILGRD